MQIQSNLASTIAMAFDECLLIRLPGNICKTVWTVHQMAGEVQEEMARLNELPDTINKDQLLFGINQGGTFEDIRIAMPKQYLPWILMVMLWAVLQ